MSRRRFSVGWRQLTLFAAMCTFACLIAHNLFYWQVLEHARMAQAAARIYDSEANVPAPRGGIQDANAVTLVMNVTAYIVAADPQSIPHPRYDAAKLARVLHRDPGPILATLTTPHARYVVIERQADMTTANAVKALGLPGIVLVPAYRASYPQGSLAANVLGFVDASGQGRYGLEASKNNELTGTDGSQLIYVDTANRPLPLGVQKPRPAVPGATLVLTLDSRIQTIVEKRLQEAIAHSGAESGTAIVMDPHTGAILAMASLPSYDPNHFGSVTNYNLFNNLAVQSYQPGSTFKLISVSAGIDSHAFTPNTTVYDPGFYTNYGMTVRNWQIGVGWGYETPAIMLKYSANVGMAQFANMIGPLTFYNYVTKRFGFGSPTGVDIPEEPGYVRTPTNGQPWRMMDLLTNSYGQGINVTPLQLVTAVASLANGGWRMRPYLVQKIVYPDHHVQVTHPQRVIRAVSAATAATMTNIMLQSGEGLEAETKCAQTKNYPTAVKTGTATIEDPAAHGLDMRAGTVASLIGFAPANDPKFVMLVTVRRPQPGPDGQGIYGAVSAAPAWHDIALSLYRLMNIPPQPGSTSPDLTLDQGPHGWNCAFTSQQ